MQLLFCDARHFVTVFVAAPINFAICAIARRAIVAQRRHAARIRLERAWWQRREHVCTEPSLVGCSADSKHRFWIDFWVTFHAASHRVSMYTQIFTHCLHYGHVRCWSGDVRNVRPCRAPLWFARVSPIDKRYSIGVLGLTTALGGLTQETPQQDPPPRTRTPHRPLITSSP